MRKIFSVYINEKKYWVYDIEGKEHEGMNGEPTTWWLYFDLELPSEFLPSIDSDSWLPFSVGVNRRLWDINISQKNTTKEKWGSTNFRNSTSVEMFCNKKKIYEFHTTGTDSGLSYAMAKIQYLQVQLTEHPFNFFEPESEQGRKIFFYGLPATIKLSSWPGEIHIVPDSSEMDLKQWWAKYKERRSSILSYDKEDSEMLVEDLNEDESLGSISWGSALEGSYINWFRK